MTIATQPHAPPSALRRAPWWTAVKQSQRFVGDLRVWMAATVWEFVCSGAGFGVFDVGGEHGLGNLFRKAMDHSAGGAARDLSDDFLAFSTARKQQVPFEHEAVGGRKNWNALRHNLCYQEATHFVAEWRHHLLVGKWIVFVGFGRLLTIRTVIF